MLPADANESASDDQLQGCPFCRLQRESEQDRAPADTILLESEHFLVVPTVGPFTSGHVMVITRGHYTSFASLPVAIRRDFDSIVEVVRRRCGSDVLEFEHGSGPRSESGGACINHVHVHVIPDAAGAVECIEGLLPRLPVESCSELTETHLPYIWLRSNSKSRFYRSSGTHSQFGRRKIWEWFGRHDWDWAANPSQTTVDATILTFRSAGRGHG